MLNLSLGAILVAAQLVSLGGGGLPQIIEPDYSNVPVGIGRSGEVKLGVKVRDGYLINRRPAMQLELQTIAGIELADSTLESSPEDPKSTNEYYVDVPAFTLRVIPGRAGSFEIPGKLTYFFCSTADGFCSRQVIDVAIPIRAE